MNNASRYSLVAIPLLLLAAIPTFAQRSPGGAPGNIDKTNAIRARQQSESRREWQLRQVGQPNVAKDSRQLKALIQQTEEDFNRILTLHNEFARLLASDKPVDYHFIAEATAEIKKRADRLQSTLGLEQLTTETAMVEKTEDLDAAHMKDAVIRVCQQIRSFVTNPVIENPNLVDAQNLTNARRDLESVIQLSGHLQKEAARMHKKHKEKP
jgi:hypothetical protein